jgi:hypothetical protein
VHGKKGNYAIVIGKYFVRDSSLTWWSVNLERTIDWRDVKFDPVTDPAFVTERAVTSSVTSPVTDRGIDAGTEVGGEQSPLKEVRRNTPRNKDEEVIGREKRDRSPENGDMPPRSGGSGIPISQSDSETFGMLKSLGSRELKGLKRTLERTLRDRRMPAAYREITRKKLNQVVSLLKPGGRNVPAEVQLGD